MSSPNAVPPKKPFTPLEKAFEEPYGYFEPRAQPAVKSQGVVPHNLAPRDAAVPPVKLYDPNDKSRTIIKANLFDKDKYVQNSEKANPPSTVLYTRLGTVDYAAIPQAEVSDKNPSFEDQQQYNEEFDCDPFAPVAIGHWTAADFSTIGRTLKEPKSLAGCVVVWPPRVTPGKNAEERKKCTDIASNGLAYDPKTSRTHFMHMTANGNYYEPTAATLKNTFAFAFANSYDAARFRYDTVTSNNRRDLLLEAPYEGEAGICLSVAVPCVPDKLLPEIRRLHDKDKRDRGLEVAPEKRARLHKKTPAAAADDADESVDSIVESIEMTNATVAARTADEFNAATGKRLNVIAPQPAQPSAPQPAKKRARATAPPKKAKKNPVKDIDTNEAVNPESFARAFYLYKNSLSKIQQLNKDNVVETVGEDWLTTYGSLFMEFTQETTLEQKKNARRERAALVGACFIIDSHFPEFADTLCRRAEGLPEPMDDDDDDDDDFF